jgi:hypothetical protein
VILQARCQLDVGTMAEFLMFGEDYESVARLWLKAFQASEDSHITLCDMTHLMVRLRG